jgi:Transposase DDE domain
LKVTAVAAGIAFHHAAQAIQIRRRRPLNSRTGQRWSAETSYAVTSLAAHQATPAQIAAWIRGHWAIEAVHHIRDVTYGEDASQIRTSNGPQVMAALRNLAIAIFKLPGHPTSQPPPATTPETPPGHWPHSGSARYDRNGHYALCPGLGQETQEPGGTVTAIVVAHALVKGMRLGAGP